MTELQCPQTPPPTRLRYPALPGHKHHQAQGSVWSAVRMEPTSTSARWHCHPCASRSPFREPSKELVAFHGFFFHYQRTSLCRRCFSNVVSTTSQIFLLRVAMFTSVLQESRRSSPCPGHPLQAPCPACSSPVSSSQAVRSEALLVRVPGPLSGWQLCPCWALLLVSLHPEAPVLLQSHQSEPFCDTCLPQQPRTP